MTEFVQAAPAVRHVVINYGDTLQTIALRELGDANLWQGLIHLNGLLPPFIVNDEADRSTGVLAAGDLIAVPASVAAEWVSNPDDVFFADVALDRGRIGVANGDMAVVSGVANLSQALGIRVVVEKLELAFHPEFGCMVRSLLGNVSSGSSASLAAFYVKSALLEDDRVSSVPSCVAEVLGDQIMVNADVVAISGRLVSVSTII